MHINQKSWHFKLWQLSSSMSPRGKYWHTIVSPKQIDLCQYLRQILVWFPLKLSLYLVPLFTVLYLMYLVFFVSITGTLTLIGAIMAIILVLSVIGIVFWLGGEGYTRVSKRVHAYVDRDDTSFMKLYAYARKTKGKFCAILEVK